MAGRSGYGTVARMVAAVALIGAGEARNRVAAAEALAPRQSLIGETLPPRCPAPAAAFAAGEISTAAVRIVTDAMRRVPTGMHPETEANAEQTLAGHARRFEPRPLAQITHRVLAHLDPDGPPPTEAPPPQRG
ncbi:MAG: 13E12 repeat family protein, partial [Actinomycetota bacterium]|nr:13E12 repeat family protein [Actinomycetota bacterium]